MKRSVFVFLAIAALSVAAYAQTGPREPESEPFTVPFSDEPETPEDSPHHHSPAVPNAPAPAPVPEAVLTPSNGHIFFSVFSNANCAPSSVMFSATVLNDAGRCQSFQAFGATIYVKMGCYSNLTVTGTNYFTDQNCATPANEFPLAASGSCAPVSVSGTQAQAFKGFCPDDPNFPREPQSSPQNVPSAASTPAALSLSLFSLVILAIFGTIVL